MLFDYDERPNTDRLCNQHTTILGHAAQDVDGVSGLAKLFLHLWPLLRDHHPTHRAKRQTQFRQHVEPRHGPRNYRPEPFPHLRPVRLILGPAGYDLDPLKSERLDYVD